MVWTKASLTDPNAQGYLFLDLGRTISSQRIRLWGFDQPRGKPDGSRLKKRTKGLPSSPVLLLGSHNLPAFHRDLTLCFKPVNLAGRQQIWEKDHRPDLRKGRWSGKPATPGRTTISHRYFHRLWIARVHGILLCHWHKAGAIRTV